MNQDFEYYVVNRKGDETVPLLTEEADSPDYLFENGPVDKPKMMLFKLGKPIPKRPQLADYLSSPNSVISKKIFDVLYPLNIEGVQLLPAKIRWKDNEIFTNYWAVHVFHKIKCVDAELSDCVMEDNMLDDVKKIVLEKEVLEQIPLKKRLVFRLKEDYSYELYHSSIVNAIMAVKPSGIGFINIEQWNEESYFDN